MLEKGSKGESVVRLQRALNVALGRVPPLRADGDFGSITEGAVMEFQNMLRLVPDGRVPEPVMQAILREAELRGWIEAPTAGGKAPWLEIGRGELGVAEQPGLAANPRILDYIATFPYLAQHLHPAQRVPMSQTDETAWCACFVNWCLLRAGQRPGPDAMAESWLRYGVSIGTPQPGAICVIFNPRLASATSASGWHVGFWTDAAEGGVIMLGGNQGNRVSETFMPGVIKGLRWPAA